MRSRSAYVSIALGVLALAAVSHLSLAGASDGNPSHAYPLDAIARVLEPGESLPCRTGALELVSYRGDRLRYQKAALIHPAFRGQLESFESIVAELALKHYGRVPRAIVHLGTYNCRVMRRYPSWVSEHALGNAIDIAGFDFGPAARDAAPSGLPRPLRRAFRVRIERHWSASGLESAHAAFLHELAEALADRPDVFHVVLGPGYPGHHNHLHLDHAPYRVVDFKK
jgi:hypothetical protein